jgi:hypothetical protein
MCLHHITKLYSEHEGEAPHILNPGSEITSFVIATVFKKIHLALE